MQPTAKIITIGDELLLGQVVDTNSAFIGATAADAGLRVVAIESISDCGKAIRFAIDQAISRVDVVIITGGLGPTKDDITKRTIADYFGVDLVRDEVTYNFVRSMLADRGVEFNVLNEGQADVPRGFTALPNPVGTAPGLYFNHNGRLIFCMPGVPFEMKKMFTEQVLPRVSEKFPLQQVAKRTVMVFGLPESELAAYIAGWESALPKYLSLAYLPSPRGIRLRLTAKTQIATSEIDAQFDTLKLLIPDYYLSDDPTSVEQELATQLLTRGETLAVAESCTGGAISALCTALAGSSEWYKGGVTSYANEVKTSILGVEPSAITTHGAVSAEVVAQMADGVRLATGSTYAIATSGIAGPTGGSDEKPVGTVWIAVASKNGVQTHLRNFGQPREVFIARASTAALNYLRMGIIKGLLTLLLALIVPSAVAQETERRPLDSLIVRMMEVNYSVLMSEQRVAKAKSNHTPKPFLPSLGANATQKQLFDELGTADQLSVGANFTWRIFDGIGMFHRYALTKEKLNTEQLLSIKLIEDLIEIVSTKYYQIIAIQNKVSVLAHSLKLSRERYAQALSKHNIGAGSGLEMRLAGADMNTDSSKLIKARESVDLAYIDMNATLLYSTTDRRYIADSIILDELPDRQAIHERASSLNSEIMIAGSELKSGQIAVKSAQSTRYPTLDLNAAYNYGVESSRPASAFYRSNGGSWGFTLGVNIFNGLETNRIIRSAKFDTKIATISKQEVENEIMSSLEAEITMYENSLVLAELESQNAEAMALNLDVAMERYRLGDLSGIDFRVIQQQYLAALESKISTEYQAKSSMLKIINICGTLDGLPNRASHGDE